MFLGEKRNVQQAVAFSWENGKQLDKTPEWSSEEGKQKQRDGRGLPERSVRDPAADRLRRTLAWFTSRHLLMARLRTSPSTIRCKILGAEKKKKKKGNCLRCCCVAPAHTSGTAGVTCYHGTSKLIFCPSSVLFLLFTGFTEKTDGCSKSCECERLRALVCARLLSMTTRRLSLGLALSHCCLDSFLHRPDNDNDTNTKL